MNKTLVYLISAIALLTCASCQRREPDSEFVNGSSVCLMIDGKKIHTYDPATWQYSFREKALKYRVFSDDMKDYYALTCNVKPEKVGQEITASLRWAAGGGKESSYDKLKFTVENIDPENGRVWLWCKRKGIGVAIICTD